MPVSSARQQARHARTRGGDRLARIVWARTDVYIGAAPRVREEGGRDAVEEGRRANRCLAQALAGTRHSDPRHVSYALAAFLEQIRP